MLVLSGIDLPPKSIGRLPEGLRMRKVGVIRIGPSRWAPSSPRRSSLPARLLFSSTLLFGIRAGWGAVRQPGVD